MKVIANNRKAYFDYEIVETFVCGIVLSGSEVKSLRSGKANLTGSFVDVREGEVWGKGIQIAQYPFSAEKIEEKRPRKLLLRKNEIERLAKALETAGMTAVPLELGFERQWAKLKIAVVRGKKKYDKRETIKKRDLERAAARGEL